MKKFKVRLAFRGVVEVEVEAEDAREAISQAACTWDDTWDEEDYSSTLYGFRDLDNDSAERLTYGCANHEGGRTIEQCERSCGRYFSCATVAMALDEEREEEDEHGYNGKPLRRARG